MSNLSQFAAGGDPQYWVSGTTYALGKTVRSPIDHQRYVRVVAGAGTTDPANDATNWRADGGRAIKSIQRGLTSVDQAVDVTISAVNPAKTQVNLLTAYSYAVPSQTSEALCRLQLVSSTVLRMSGYKNANTYNAASLSWEVIEFH